MDKAEKKNYSSEFLRHPTNTEEIFTTFIINRLTIKLFSHFLDSIFLERRRNSVAVFPLAVAVVIATAGLFVFILLGKRIRILSFFVFAFVAGSF